MRSWLKPTRTEWITFFVLMPVIDTIALYIMFGERLWSDVTLWLYAFWIGYIVGLATFWLNVMIMHRFQQLMPELKQTPKRVTLIVLAHVLTTSTVFGIVLWFYDTFGLFGFEANIEQFKL